VSTASNCRYNWDGNVTDEDGESTYVLDATGEPIAGPFGSTSYALDVRDRMRGQGYQEPLKLHNRPDGPIGVESSDPVGLAGSN